MKIDTYLFFRCLIFQITFFTENLIGCDWTGATDAETWSCCSSEIGSQCGLQEGHCSNDDECYLHLKCGTGNCNDENPLSKFPIGSNCCYDPIPSKMKKMVQWNLSSIQERQIWFLKS